MSLPFRFNLEDVTTWGLEVDYRYGGYKLPIIMRDFPTEREKISIFAEANNVRSPFYGRLDTLYLRLYNLTEKQEKEILYKGRLKINLEFSLIEIGENKRGVKFLHFEVTGLGKVGTIFSHVPPKDI